MGPAPCCPVSAVNRSPDLEAVGDYMMKELVVFLRLLLLHIICNPGSLCLIVFRQPALMPLRTPMLCGALATQDLSTVGLGKMGVQFHTYTWEALASSSEPRGLSRCSSSPYDIGLSDSPWVPVDHTLTSFCFTQVFCFYCGWLLLMPWTVGSAAFPTVRFRDTCKPWILFLLPAVCSSRWFLLPRVRLPKTGRVTSNSGREVKRDKAWWFGTFFVFPYIGNNYPN